MKPILNSVRNVFLALAFVAATSVAATGALAQDAKKPAAKKPAANWVVNCNPTQDGASMVCAMSQTFNDAKSKKRIMAISIQPQPKDKAKRPLMVLALPHGLHFPSGVTVTIDKQTPIKVELRTSNANGVYTATPLDAKFIAAMRKGTQLKVTMYAAENSPIAIPVSLVGFAAAFSKINSSQ